MPDDVVARRFEAQDLPEVVDLYRACFPAAGRRPRAEVARKLGQLFVDGPLRDERFPSLVACDAAGRVAAFSGRLRRGWRHAGGLLSGTTGTGLMVRRELRRSGVASALRTLSRGIEAETGALSDVGFSDRSTADGRAFGLANPNRRAIDLEQFGLDWLLPLHPRAHRALERLRRRLPAGVHRTLERALAPALRALPARALPRPPPLRSAPLSPAALVEALDAAGRDRPLRLDEPVETCRWLLDYLSDYASRGRFSGRVLLAEGGAPLGFAAGYTQASGGFELLAFAAPLAEEEALLDEVLREAAAGGARFVSGSANARELRHLLRRGAAAVPSTHASVRCKDPALYLHFLSMQALVTGLEGERWL
jgi:hypothetical protein